LTDVAVELRRFPSPTVGRLSCLREVQIFVGATDGQAVVRVRDDGSGMTEEVKRQAFEPFFTTRSAGEGSGLGLAIVASIVRAHQGTVTLSSEPGKGTAVELHLPLEADAIIAAELSAAEKERASIASH
jgi:signal transduction histidine kinase